MKKLWFKAKTYGYGWGLPCAWQGWLVLVVYLVLSVGTFRFVDARSHSGSDTLIAFVPLFALYTLVLILICFVTGEKLRWRWGGK